ncbi:MAG: MoxR family ATPase [Kiritimatiellaeota bacterium]|nr:MoxR family ATPase [Kiritimatiellota bacterium]
MGDTTALLNTLDRTRAEVANVVFGQETVIDFCLVAILCNQHALIEGVPGIAKTLLVRTLAAVLGCDFGRIQFTPDLMPADITGTSVFDVQTGQFRLLPGPVFTSFLLADEINRAPAKTQSALLQAMQERRVTIDRDTHALPPDFTVFATQNPIEYEGTYPLPEAQRDRFMLKIPMAYPGQEEEMALAHAMLSDDAPESRLDRARVSPTLDGATLAQLRQCLAGVTVRDELVRYAVEIVRATRTRDSVLLGAGPRATQALVLGARALAAVRGKDFVTPDHLREIVLPVLGHRMVLRPEHEVEGLTTEEVITQLLTEVAVPR